MAYNQGPSSAEDQAPVKTVLVVEDEEELSEFIVQALQQETPYQALFVTDGFQALKMVRSLKPNLFLLDYHLPSIDRKSTRLNSSHGYISYAVFCLKKKNIHKLLAH